MLETICPQCQAGNMLGNRYCGQCGAYLKTTALLPHRENSIIIGGRSLPAQQLKQVGVSLAVGLATLLAEAGLAWLRRRLDGQPHITTTSAILPTVFTPTSHSSPTLPAVVESDPPPATVTVVRERIVEIHRWGRPVQRIIERMAWRREG